MNQKLIQLLRTQTDFTFQCISLEPQLAKQLSDDRVLYEAIRAKMKYCDAALILCGVYTTYSRWINKELIAASSELHKPVLGILPSASVQPSFIVKQHANALVRFDAAPIIAALKRLTNNG